MQPETAAKPSELMAIDETCAFFGGDKRPIDASTLYRGIKAGRYPKPVKVGPSTNRWLRSDCEAALLAMIRASRASA